MPHLNSERLVPFHILTPVWGSVYTKLFVDVSLPVLLSPENIPVLQNRQGSLYRIFTTKADRAVIEASPAYELLARTIAVEFHEITTDPADQANPYNTQSDCYRLGIELGNAADAALIFHNADVVMADGGFRYLVDAVDTGKRAVMAMGVRLNKEDASSAIRSYQVDKSSPEITLTPRDLSRIALDNLHQLTKLHIFNRRKPKEWLPFAIFWEVRNGLLMRCFNLHPVVVYPEVKDAQFSKTIDHDYLEAACPNPTDTVIVQDSDLFCACELSRHDLMMDVMPWQGSAVEIARWAHFHTTSHYRSLLGSTIRLHAAGCDGREWLDAQAQSDAVVREVLEKVDDVEALGGEDILFEYGSYSEPQAYVPIHFVTSVWGAEYACIFSEVMLPSVLSLRNIKAIPNKEDCVYRIYTCGEGREIIENSDAVRLLSEHIAVEFHPVDETEENRYVRSSNCYRDSIQKAAEHNSASVFLIPDMVLADGSIESICRILGMGKRAILITGFRVLRNEVIASVKRDYLKDDIVSIQPRDLVSLALQHPHPISESHLFEGNNPFFHPAGCYWRLDDVGYLMHCFHLHPVAVYPKQTDFTFTGTIDDDFLFKANIKPRDTYIVDSSDDILWCELSPAEYAVPTPARSDMPSILDWIRKNTNALHQSYIRQPLRLLAVEYQRDDWDAVEQCALLKIDDLVARSKKRSFLPTLPVAVARMVHLFRGVIFRAARKAQEQVDTARANGSAPPLLSRAYLAVYSVLSRLTKLAIR
ncbi:hypothetical protein HH303_19710 [Rhodospirillaceae bacterium KN72]|uniref:Uncharacterized protein n=1 Tax=Pacificispira spongiicola TaxID=2729598 RepID=A0A7Y0E3T3_9PROT|nr:hypothetical protein [Pacificispira spongiicola]NMM46725.1 hypothetical protein [Pacificispira spongiicola]